ncbi:MAG: N-acetylmuramoyl-L-alanine amidase [Bacteroidales bacterium]
MESAIKNGKRRAKHISILTFNIPVILLLCLAVNLSAVPSQKTWIIVIDAGHGGKDPGAVGAKSFEKNIALAIALKTGSYIEKNISNVKVLYTRRTDSFPELSERAEFANRNKADLFISIHANWAANKNVRGTETYIMGRAKDEQNLAVAMKENEVILLEDDFSTKYEGFDPKSPESYIMFTLMQNIFQEQSTNLASNIQEQFINRAGRVDRGVRQAVFWVLYMTTMPSVLVETGYITNAGEELYLNSPQGQDYIASAIFRATRDYINEADKKNNISSSAGSNEVIEKDSTASVPGKQEGDIYFMVQIASSIDKTETGPSNFKGLKDVVELASAGRFRYATGSFMKYLDAVEYKKKLETIYPDAFVIAVRNNKVLPLQEAFELKQNK